MSFRDGGLRGLGTNEMREEEEEEEEEKIGKKAVLPEGEQAKTAFVVLFLSFFLCCDPLSFSWLQYP